MVKTNKKSPAEPILFSDLEQSKQSTATTKKISTIVPSKKTGKVQSVEQKKFASLTKKIEKLKKELKGIPEREQIIRQFYAKKIEPGLKMYSTQMKENLKELDRWYEQGKLTAKRRDILAKNLIGICTQLLSFEIDDEENAQMLTDYCYKYTEIQTGLTAEEQKQKEVEEMSEMMEVLFGIKLDEGMENIHNTSDLLQQLQEKMREQQLNGLNDQKDKEKNTNTQTAKKVTKKELEKQLREQQEMKSLRNIYIELVSELHPDKEPDEQLKQKKEEQLKNITEAYRNKDIFALLTMQLNWLEESELGLENQPNAILKRYNSLMEKQLNQLQSQVEEQRNRPIFGVPMHYGELLFESNSRLQRSLKNFEEEKESMLFEAHELKMVMRQKKTLNRYLDESAETDDESFMEDLLALFFENEPQRRYR